MRRTRTFVYIAITLDGFIARDDGTIDFLDVVQSPDEDYGYAEFTSTIDALVMGRKTYETVLGFDEWPFDGKRVFVLTRGAYAPRRDETFVDGEPAAVLERLAHEGLAHVYLDGGETIRAFLREGLVHELTLSIVPVLLGSGRRLFESGLPETRLELVDSRAYASGLVQVRYRVPD